VRASQVRVGALGNTPYSPAVSRVQRPDSDSPDFRVEFDWRGETACYVEGDRRVMLSCIYWGGPTGSVSHLWGVWEHPDGRRETLTADERASVLARVSERSRKLHGIELEIEGG
jgi:hypothetical protein